MMPDDNIRAKCFHPTGTFVEFKTEEIEQSIPERFEKIARAHPDRIAVKSARHKVTYEALNQQSNKIARALLEERGEGEEPVALLFRHDTPVICGILGVLKAGKIYMPLDASAATARITHILEASRAGIIMTDAEHLSQAERLANKRLRLLNVDGLDFNSSSENIGLPLLSENYAYLIYTSGSTGEPKGVIQSHRNVLHSVMNNTNGLRVGFGDRLTLIYQYYTNGAAHDVFTALANGASLHIFDIRTEGLAPLAQWLIQEKVTIYHSVRSVFRHFAYNLSDKQAFPDLRAVSLGGEAVSKIDVEHYHKFFPETCIFVNRLGSTESGRISWYFIDKQTEIDGPTVPVGFATPGYEIKILDDNGAPCSFGRAGEIAVKSLYLSPGYWQRPDLTRTKFLPDPDGGDKRMYLTGDLGRQMPDGCLHYIGRKDLEVRIRGQWVQVADIESALLEHDRVKDAAVVPYEDRQNETRLVAYFVPCGNLPSYRDLQLFLSNKLPSHMLPAALIKLDVMPLTPGGKVNRNALPVPGSTRPELDTRYVPPATPIEQALAGMWAEVLSLDQVGIHDNFFDLGGHSLAATRVISRVIKTFRLEMPLNALFNSPTVARMAEVIAEHQEKKLGDTELKNILNDLETLSDEGAERLVSKDRALSTDSNK